MFRLVRMWFRIIVIGAILARYRIDELVLHSAWFYPFRFICYFNPMHYFSAKSLTAVERLRCALEKLGPIYIKFGQLLSTRRDLIPPDIAEELSKLQDSVKPFPSEIAKAMIEASLGGSVKDIFAEFSDEALASASIAQVHGAVLQTGESVVVKVLRPNVKKNIQKDLDILKALAKLAHHFLANGNRLRPKEVVKEFEISLYAELDLAREAANASLLRRNFQDSSILYIPEVYWDYCKQDVMVMERIHGVPIYDLERLKRQGSDFHELAKNGMTLFFKQVFEDNFFHADMHPGNLFVSEENKTQFIAVDFGIVGSLSDSDRRYIAENLLAFLNRDYRRIALLHIESGWVDADTRVDDFEAALRTISEPVFEKPLKDISMGQVMLNLFRIAREFNITIQPQLILLQKTLFNIESLGRNLNPDLDLWKTAKPHLERWVKAQMGPKRMLKRLSYNLPKWIEKFPDMPDLLYDTLQTIKLEKEGRVCQRSQIPGRERGGLYALFGAGVGLLIGAALSMHPAGSTVASWVLFGVGVGLLGVSAWFKLWQLLKG